MRKYKIPKKDRKTWLEALESGTFVQGKNRLHNEINNTFCCLGVFCYIKGVPTNDYNMPNQLPLAEHKNIPKCLLGKYEDEKPMSKVSFAAKLARMNDDGMSFKEIAKYIRKNTVGV